MGRSGLDRMSDRSIFYIRCIGADKLTMSFSFAGGFAMHNLRTEGRIKRGEERNVSLQKVRGWFFIVVDNSFSRNIRDGVSSTQLNRVDRACPSTKEDPASRRSSPASTVRF